MDCQNCGYEIKGDWNLCPNCGVQLKEEITEKLVCKNCGREIKSGWEQCQYCGIKLKGSKQIDFKEAKNLVRSLKGKLDDLLAGRLQVVSNNYYLTGIGVALILIIISIVFLLGTARSNDILWQKVYTAEKSSFLSVHDTAAGYLLGGQQKQNSYLLSVDQAGSQQWIKSKQNWGSVIDIIELDQGYLVGFEEGIITHVDSQGHQSIIYDVQRKILALAYHQGETIILSKDSKLIKLNQQRETEWTKKFPGELKSKLHLRVNNLSYTRQGNILLVFDQQVYKLTSLGKIIWEQSFNHHLYTIKEDSKGEIVVAGTDAEYKDASLIKLNQAGEKVWTRNYNHTRESIFDLAISSNGYLLVGATIADNNNSDGYAIKVDQTGRLEWSKQYGGTEVDLLATVKEIKEQGYLAVGMSNSFGAVDQAAYAVRINQLGEIIPRE